MHVQILTTILLWDIQGNEREKILNISLKSFFKKCHKKLTNLEKKKKDNVFENRFFVFQNKTKQKHILQYKKNPKVFRIFKIQIQWHGCGLQTSFKIYREGLATMKPEIISRETIKPSFPTPHSQI